MANAANRTTGPQRLVIGISGASGAIYGVRLLQLLQKTPIETHLVMSHSAVTALARETDWETDAVRALADVSHGTDDIGAAISSGSFTTMGMIVAPCSIRTLSSIATGVTANLLTRAADVTLKEKRRLVLMVREAPLHLGHLRTMAAAAEIGATVFPPVPAFYARPAGIGEMVDHTLGRVLDQFGVDIGVAPRWEG